MMNCLIKQLLPALLLLLSFNASQAQSSQLFTPADSVPVVELRYLHPFYESVDKQGLLSGGYDFTLSYPMNNNWNIQVSLPLLFAKYEVESLDFYGSYGANVITKNDNAVGNIMIGANYNQHQANNRTFSFMGQIYLPTAPHNLTEAVEYVAYANFNEVQKYLGNTTTILAKVAYSSFPKNSMFYSLNGGFQYQIAGDEALVENEFYTNLGFTTGYNFNSVAVSADYAALIVLGEGDFEKFRDRMVDVLSLGIHYTKGKFNPGIFYSFYTQEDYRDLTSGVLGIKLAYRFK
ncbi:MAG: hypothetical protein N4A74_00055 [Carboxylicivirga sp.]|nr:hypothetical protein [Carboxylicivirga sp.]